MTQDEQPVAGGAVPVPPASGSESSAVNTGAAADTVEATVGQGAAVDGESPQREPVGDADGRGEPGDGEAGGTAEGRRGDGRAGRERRTRDSRRGAPRPRGDRTPAPSGLVIVDKPTGFTSHDVVAKMRGIARTRRVGHAGTLDPMATGVLVLGLERATKLLGHLALTEKEYLGTIRLGQDTLTDDAEGEITSSADASGVVRTDVDAGVAGLTGDIMQVPSRVSAIKIDGVRSYKRAREGEEFDIPARPVRVSSFLVHDMRHDSAEDGTPVVDLVVSVTCSSGTYIRALARDLGSFLGTGGHLTALRRTRVGPYRLASARTLDALQEELTVMPLAEAAGAAFPRWDVDARRAQLLLNGVRVDMPEEYSGRGTVAVFGPDGQFLVLVEELKGKAKSLAVFA